MKDLCIDARMSFNSGIGTYIRNLVSQLKNSPFKIKLIVHKEAIDKWPECQSFDLITSSSPIYSIEEQIKLPLIIPKCDLFWSPHYNIPTLPIRAKKRILTLHDVYHLAFRKALNLPQKIYATTMINAATRFSDAIITNSLFSKSEIIKYTNTPKDKIHPIYLGIDHKHFKKDFESSYLTAIKHKYQLPEKFFLFVSNLAPHKNIPRLLDAWNSLQNSYPHWKLILVGKQTHNADYQKTNLASLHTQFLGHIENEDLPGIYHQAYATIHPSLYEGFGITPLESMKCGTPTILSNIASLPEIYEDCALYIDPYSTTSIAQGMKQMIEEPTMRQTLALKGYKKSLHFCWKQTTEKHLETFEKITKNK